MATKAGAILLDESTANLDPAHAIDVLELCHCLSREGKLVILTTQDLPMAARYVKRVVLLKSGVVLGAGSVDNTLTEPAVYSVFGVHADRAYTTGGETTFIVSSSSTRSHELGRGDIVPHTFDQR